MDKQRSKKSAPSQRQQRVGELLRHVLSERLMRGELLSEELYGRPLLVGEVRMTPDLRWARAYVSFAKQAQTSQAQTDPAPPDPAQTGVEEEEKGAVLKELKRLAPTLQKSCAAPLRLKFTPRIVFVWDDLGERSAKIEQLLQRHAQARLKSES